MEKKTVMLVLLSLVFAFARGREKCIIGEQPLINVHGKPVKLSDYRGKVVVLDFWFTGCVNCMKFFQGELSAAERHFERDSNVVFISICIDKDKDTWLRSLEKGKYASRTSIDLYTNGMGDQHPVIKAFDVVSYPQPIVLDRMGGVISRSDSLTRADRLIETIEMALTGFGANEQAKHVVLISIDGFHPDMYLDSTWPTPNLRELMKAGTYADHLLSVFPAYTYPSHTAMITGALPARSKVVFNQPMGSKGEWNWYARYIKVPTLWQALKAKGLIRAAVMWPASVGAEVDYNMSEIWAVDHPDDRITETRKHATPGLVEEIERNATGKLDSTNMSDGYLSLDENAGRAAAYIFKTYHPAFLALHFAEVDGFEHDQGRDGDSVRLAVACNDRAIGDVLEAIEKSGEKDSTAVIIVGDHGFSTIHTLFRPNMLIRGVSARFIAAGGSCFLYPAEGVDGPDLPGIVQAVADSLNRLPKEKRKLFRIINRMELDRMGADSSAILALSAVPGVVFSGSLGAHHTENHGPGTLIQQTDWDGVFVPAHGGHHGYDPREPDMHTGFIAKGAGIIKGGHIHQLCVTDIAPLVAKLLGVPFTCPDGKLVSGILANQ